MASESSPRQFVSKLLPYPGAAVLMLPNEITDGRPEWGHGRTVLFIDHPDGILLQPVEGEWSESPATPAE